MTEYLKVEGSSTLVRDPHSKAILNLDEGGFEAYMALRKANEEKRKTQQTMKQEIDELRSDINEIKSLLIKLLEK